MDGRGISEHPLLQLKGVQGIEVGVLEFTLLPKSLTGSSGRANLAPTVQTEAPMQPCFTLEMRLDASATGDKREAAEAQPPREWTLVVRPGFEIPTDYCDV